MLLVRCGGREGASPQEPLPGVLRREGTELVRSGRVANTLFTFQRRPECGQGTSQRPHSSGRYWSAARAPAPPRPPPVPPPGPARRRAWPQPVRAPPGGGAAGGEQASRPSTPRHRLPPTAFPAPLSRGTQPALMGLRVPSFLFPGKLPPSGHYIRTPGRLLWLPFRQPRYSAIVFVFYLLPVKSGENQWLPRGPNSKIPTPRLLPLLASHPIPRLLALTFSSALAPLQELPTLACHVLPTDTLGPETSMKELQTSSWASQPGPNSDFSRSSAGGLEEGSAARP